MGGQRGSAPNLSGNPVSLFLQQKLGAGRGQELLHQARCGTRGVPSPYPPISQLWKNILTETNISLDLSLESCTDCLCLKHVFSCYSAKGGKVALLGMLEIWPLEYSMTLHLEP